MKLRRSTRLLITALFTSALAASAVFAQDNYRAEAASAPSSGDLPKALLDALQPSGARLISGQGAPIAEVWLRKSIPTTPGSGSSSDTLYPNLSTGTFVGVIHFPGDGSDFRGQTIKAGFYTLRYALVPQDGNHMGVSTNRDFLLLAPVSADTQIDRTVSFDDLVKLSKQASGTNHPAVLSMAQASGNTTSATRDDQGHWMIQLSAQGKSASGAKSFAMGIILIGKSDAA